MVHRLILKVINQYEAFNDKTYKIRGTTFNSKKWEPVTAKLLKSMVQRLFQKNGSL